MIDIGEKERQTQDRVVKLFQNQLGYDYLGNLQNEENQNIDKTILNLWLQRRGVSDNLIIKAIREIEQVLSIGGGKKLYDANKQFYLLLRYGIKIKEDVGSHTQTIWLIDWKDIEANRFSIAEEVSIKGEHNKRPDIVLYINGIAICVLELKRSTVSVSKGIHQNLDNQKKDFIRDFFATTQLLMAGNDTQGLRYATTETTERYYQEWKEENPNFNPKIDTKTDKFLSYSDGGNNRLDFDIIKLLNKERLLDVIHNFILFDKGQKKTCRQNQYFGIQSAKKYIKRREGGIIWHTQGSGKSLTMVWLAKWIKENIPHARVLIITDRTELDEQIEGVFQGAEEKIYRTSSGQDLIATLASNIETLICSLVHKFGVSEKKSQTDEFIKEIESNLPKNFEAKGDIFVFVDECHRTQSGDLHKAMKKVLPNAMFIGFTGTPLLKKDKQKSIEIFGSYIHTYKFDEAVADGVVLDLQYESRDIDQYISNEDKIDKWFENKTKGLTKLAKTQLKQRWGTLQKVLSSKSRLDMIVQDILFDMEDKPRLMDGRGNAMLVCSTIYEACKTYELFSKTNLKDAVAIVTSYKPSIVDIKGVDSGEGQNEELLKYEIYRKMLSNYFEESEDEAINKIEEFEKQVKDRFVNEPARMRLLIVVDKLLTGFDAPNATYLYIDKKLRDHGLFQAICRVNRLGIKYKKYGYIVDYEDLFNNIEGVIGDYTSGALDGFDNDDVKGLLTNRVQKDKERLENARESIKALCELVEEPKSIIDYQHYFCGKDTSDEDSLKDNEAKRLLLYKTTVALIRSYANIAGDYEEAGYSIEEIQSIKQEVVYYIDIRDTIKIFSGDAIDMKLYDPAMRQLIDMFIKSDDSEVVIKFDNIGLIDLFLTKEQDDFNESLPKGLKNNYPAMSEAIENNVRKIIVDSNPLNPKYYDNMSKLLNQIIEMRKKEIINYKEYLEKLKDLAFKVKNSSDDSDKSIPDRIDTSGKKVLYDNLDSNEDLTIRIDAAIQQSKKDNWIGNTMKERKVQFAILKELGEEIDRVGEIMDIVKKQYEYQ